MKKIEIYKLTTKDNAITEALVKINEIIDCLNETENLNGKGIEVGTSPSQKIEDWQELKDKIYFYILGYYREGETHIRAKYHADKSWEEITRLITTLLAKKKAEVENWISKNEYCAKCCSPKKFCQDWGKYPSAIDTKDFKLFINQIL